MPRNWRFLPHDTTLVGRLTRELGVSALTAQVLVARGYTDADRFKVLRRAGLSSEISEAWFARSFGHRITARHARAA